MFEDISYFFGAFLGDGSRFSHSAGKKWRVEIVGADKEIITRCYFSVSEFFPSLRKGRLNPRVNAWGTTVYSVAWNGKEFADAVYSVVGNKDNLPPYIWEAGKTCKLAMLAGLMDTDGSIVATKDNNYHLKFAGIHGFVYEVPALLKSVDIKVGKLGSFQPSKYSKEPLHFYLHNKSAYRAGFYFRCRRKHYRWKQWMIKMKRSTYEPPTDWISEMEGGGDPGTYNT